MTILGYQGVWVRVNRVATVSEKSGKMKFFQGQGKVSEFCIWSGKFGILLKFRETYVILDNMSTKSQEQRKEIGNEESILNV